MDEEERFHRRTAPDSEYGFNSRANKSRNACCSRAATQIAKTDERKIDFVTEYGSKGPAKLLEGCGLGHVGQSQVYRMSPSSTEIMPQSEFDAS